MKALLLVLITLVLGASAPATGMATAGAQSVVAKETNSRSRCRPSHAPAPSFSWLKKASSIVHDLWVRGGGRSFHTKLIQPHKSATLRTTLRKGVRYRIWCNVDAHAKLGMNGFFVAR